MKVYLKSSPKWNIIKTLTYKGIKLVIPNKIFNLLGFVTTWALMMSANTLFNTLITEPMSA